MTNTEITEVFAQVNWDAFRQEIAAVHEWVNGSLACAKGCGCTITPEGGVLSWKRDPAHECHKAMANVRSRFGITAEMWAQVTG